MTRSTLGSRPVISRSTNASGASEEGQIPGRSAGGFAQATRGRVTTGPPAPQGINSRARLRKAPWLYASSPPVPCRIPFHSRCPLTDVLSARVLVLNRYFQPVQLTTARRAFVLLYGGAAMAVDEGGEAYDFSAWREVPVREGDDALPIVGGALRVPRVVHLHRYERSPRPTVRLTRRNLMLRDGHQCQYCAKRPPIRELNIDHILPRSRGGMDTWENLVTACRICNLAQRLAHARRSRDASLAFAGAPALDHDRADSPRGARAVQRVGAVPEGWLGLQYAHPSGWA